MKEARVIRGAWLRRLGKWWLSFKGDLEQIVWCESPGAEAWGAMRDIVEGFDEVIEAEEEGTLVKDHPHASLAASLLRLREYVDDVSGGPVLETRLGRRLFDAAINQRFGRPTLRPTEEATR